MRARLQRSDPIDTVCSPQSEDVADPEYGEPPTITDMVGRPSRVEVDSHLRRYAARHEARACAMHARPPGAPVCRDNTIMPRVDELTEGGPVGVRASKRRRGILPSRDAPGAEGCRFRRLLERKLAGQDHTWAPPAAIAHCVVSIGGSQRHLLEVRITHAKAFKTTRAADRNCSRTPRRV